MECMGVEVWRRVVVSCGAAAVVVGEVVIKLGDWPLCCGCLGERDFIVMG